MKALLQQALDAFNRLWDSTDIHPTTWGESGCYKATEDLRAAIAQPESEPVAEPFHGAMEIGEYQAALDAGMLAQNYCRSLFGAARGHTDWRKYHDAFVAGYIACKKSAPVADYVPLSDERILEVLSHCHNGMAYPQDDVCGPRAMRIVEGRAIERAVRGKS